MKRENHWLCVTVKDRIIKEPVPDVEIEVEVPEEDETVSTTTGSEDTEVGVAKFDFAPRVKRAMLTIRHEKYREQTEEIYVKSGGIDREVHLSRKEGAIAVDLGNNGTDLAGQLCIVPHDDFIQEMYDERVDIDPPDSGSEEFTLMVGEYDIKMDEELSQSFEDSSQTVTVSDKERVTAEFQRAFDVSLTDAHQARIETLRDGLSQLPEGEGDIAVQSYFVSVLASVLDSVEAAESSSIKGEMLYEPTELVDGVLSAVQAWQGDVGAALSSESMAEFAVECDTGTDVEVTWEGTAGLKGLVELQSEGVPSARNKFSEKCDDVAALLSASEDETGDVRAVRDDVATVAPLVAMFNRVDERVSGDDSDGDEFDHPATALATYYIGICLLEAIEDAFDNEDIQSRLTETNIEPDPAVRPSGRLGFLPF